MKIHIAYLIFFVILLSSRTISETGDSQYSESWYQSREEEVGRWAAAADHDGIKNLGEYVGLFGQLIGGCGTPGPRWSDVYGNARSSLLQIPGHAKYFADELERLRLGPSREYDRLRVRYFTGILRRLPSPETIQVLGHYLDDERDHVPGFDDPVRYREVRLYPDSYTENARLATYALSRIGLQNAPCHRITSYNDNRTDYWQENLQKCRDWYAKVKSGKLAFSFIGQNVEYRFKPDGTWETTEIDVVDPPPAEQPEQSAIPSVESPAPQDTLDAIESKATSSSPLWPWLAAGGILLIAAAIWRSKVGKNRRS